MAFLNNMVGITYTNETRTAQRAGYIQNALRKDIGIFEGIGNECQWTIAAQEVTVNEGIIYIQGRATENDISTIDIPLATGANEFGYVVLKVDLGQAAGSQNTIATTQQVGSLPTLQQDSFKTLPASAIYEFPIMSYEVSTTGVVSTQDERVIIEDTEIGDETLLTSSQTIKGAINENYTALQELPINENLLINGNFDIWQRGTSFTNSDYTADRWFKGTNGSVSRVSTTLSSDSKYALRFTSNSASANILRQKLENPNNILYNKQSTISFYARASQAVTLTVRLRNETTVSTIQQIDYNVTTSWQKFELTFNSSTNWSIDDVIGIYLINDDVITSGQWVEFDNVKFEVGDTATEFIPKTYDEEFEACQRYYQVAAIDQSTYISDNNQTIGVVNLVKTLRTSPTIVAQGNIVRHNHSDSTVITLATSGNVLNLDSSRNNLIQIIFTNTVSDGSYYNINSSTSANNKISVTAQVALDAEL